MDRVSKEARSRIMSAIRSKDTEIELVLRRELHRRGFRYRIHYGAALGKPDVAFPGAKVAIFCDSEFWHGYRWRKLKPSIRSNRQYWIPKIEHNIARDKQVTAALRNEGWVVLRFWGNEILHDLHRCVKTIEDALAKGHQQ